jgi:hypothetical protein
MAMKTLINRTGNELRVTLIVRKGDHPDETAGTVDVVLGAAPKITEAAKTADNKNEQDVTYGNDVDIYLNGLSILMVKDGSGIERRDVVLTRGSALDNELNMHDTIEFLFDGKSILVSATNSAAQSFAFPVSE